MTLVSLLGVVGLVLVNLFSNRLRFLRALPAASGSLAGGISVAYDFVHLLPELSDGQEVITEVVGESLAFLESQVYLVALLGLTTFYGLKQLATSSRRSEVARRTLRSKTYSGSTSLGTPSTTSSSATSYSTS